MSSFGRLFLPGAVCLALIIPASAQQKSKVELEPNEAIFSVVTAMNVCGYDDGLDNSDPIRQEVRKKVGIALADAANGVAIQKEMCDFYRDHSLGDSARDLSQYISLALNLGDAPDFKPKVKEADLPPDSTYVLGWIPLVSRFYKTVHLGDIWKQEQPKYDALIDKLNPPLAKMIFNTDVYLKMQIQGYVGRQFVIYVEPMAAPGQVNARNYGTDYFIVSSPTNAGTVQMDQLRHTYLHFTLDPLAQKRPAAMKRIEPILKSIQGAPLDEAYKEDTSLLVTESLIRAIEARTIPGGKAAEPERQKEVQADMADGFVLTRYFYDVLGKFENNATGLTDDYPNWLYYLDVGHEQKVASEIQFSSSARQEVISGKAKPMNPLELAQRKIGQNDLDGAQKLVQPVAEAKGPDSPRAYFLLGQIATLNRDETRAISYFQQALQTAKEPSVIAWSHIYLGRIYDVDDERDMAVKHYQAALAAGDKSPQTIAAAQRGLNASYERKTAPDSEEQQEKQ